MVDGLKNCTMCGRLFAPLVSFESTESLDEYCEDCLFAQNENSGLVERALEVKGLKTIPEISEATGLSLNEVTQIVESSHFLSSEVEVHDLCSMCGLRPSQQGSHFCLPCRLDMHSSLSAAAQDLAAKVDPKPGYLPVELDDSHSVGEALSAKRRRTGSHRFGGVPSSVKKY